MLENEVVLKGQKDRKVLSISHVGLTRRPNLRWKDQRSRS